MKTVGIVGGIGPESTRESIDGLILGGTELPLLLRDGVYHGIRFLDTTQIHVKSVVSQLVA